MSLILACIVVTAVLGVTVIDSDRDEFALMHVESGPNIPTRHLIHFHQCYTMQNDLGIGGTGRVWAAMPCSNRKKIVAVKTCNEADRAMVQREVQFLKKYAAISSHYKGIPRLYDICYEPLYNRVYIVMLYFQGHRLKFHHLFDEDQPPNKPQAEIMRILYKITAIINMIHSLGFAHLDLKPNNVLCDDDGNVMVIDFGCALPMRESDRKSMQTSPSCGAMSPKWCAPEMSLIDESMYGYSSDIYMLGNMVKTLIEGIKKERFHLDRINEFISLTAKDPPHERITADQLLRHSVFQPEYRAIAGSSDHISLSEIVKLKGYNSMYDYDTIRLPAPGCNHDPNKTNCWARIRRLFRRS